MRSIAAAAVCGPMSLSTSRFMRPRSVVAAASMPIAPPIDVPSQWNRSSPSWSTSAVARLT
jgi:hypothetical protein